MLVLSRERDESVVIGEGTEEIEVMIVDVRGGKVRLGITAPGHIPVHRKEVADAIAAEEKAAEKAAELVRKEDE